MKKRNEFRKELEKLLPGHKWTIHRKMGDWMAATGKVSAGFSRLSTIKVIVSEKKGYPFYTVKSSGFGLRSPWLEENGDFTLATAVRGLQQVYEIIGRKYLKHAHDIEQSRQRKG